MPTWPAPVASLRPRPLPASHLVDVRHLDRAYAHEVRPRQRFAPGQWALRRVRRDQPVLYLPHGCCDGYVVWSRSTDLEELTRPPKVLVTMPDRGPVGFYSDQRTRPASETFHTDELPGCSALCTGALTARSSAGCL